MRPIFQLEVNGKLQPLEFFSRNFPLAETRYSMYDCELAALYIAIRHFPHMLEGHNGHRCHTMSDEGHKPLVFAFYRNCRIQNVQLYKVSDSKDRQFDFMSQITTDIRHVKGEKNAIADLLSRIHSLTTAIID